MRLKKPIKLYNLTDIAEEWKMSRGGSWKHYRSGNIKPDHTHYHGSELFWQEVPPRPERKKK
jgi:hypothetical protein